MSVMDDVLSHIFQTVHPDASPDDIAKQVSGLKAAGSDAVNQALSAIPGLSSIKDAAVNAPAVMDEAAKSPTVQSIASGLTGGPIADNVPNPGNPVSDVSQGLVAGMANDKGAPVAPAAASAPILPPPTGDTPPETPPAANAAPSAPALPPAAPPVPANIDPTEDQRRREGETAALEQKRRMGLLPDVIAGAGDAIASGAKAFGVNNPTDTEAKLVESQKANRLEDKGNFEDKLKQDPNSDISKSYRQMVSQIAPEMAKNPAFQNMSAQAIGDKLPLIDTMMKAQAQKDAKEMGLKQMQSNKDISLGLREDQQQDKLEQQYKQQLMSVRGDPNISGLEKQRDGAAQAYNILAQSKQRDGGYNLSDPQLVELYNQIQIATSGKGLTEGQLQVMNQATAKQKAAAIATFVGMSPSATTQAIGDRLMHMSTVLGQQTQGNLDKRMENRILPPSGLKPERAAPITKAGRGYTFQELVQKSDERKAGAVPQTGARSLKNGASYTVEP